jgi:energy-coupling factor transport system substrate-specific component
MIPAGRPFRFFFAYTIAIACALLNFGLGTLDHVVGLPLYFDSIFTMVSTAAFGIGPGIVTAAATNFALSMANDVLFPFALCNVVTALITAYMRRRRGLDSLTRYLWLGLWSGLSNAILGSLISSLLYGGISNVHRIDDLVSGLVLAGQSLAGSVFMAGLLTNLVDKELSAIAAFGLVLAAGRLLEGRCLHGVPSPPWRSCARSRGDQFAKPSSRA